MGYLIRHAGEVVTRQQILDAVWGADPDVYSNVVDLYVHYLRGKLESLGRREMLRTVRGVGYSPAGRRGRMSPGPLAAIPPRLLLRRTRLRLATVTLLMVTTLVVAVGVDHGADCHDAHAPGHRPGPRPRRR